MGTSFLYGGPALHVQEKELNKELEVIFHNFTEIKSKMRDRLELGTTAATSVPIMLTGKKPKRSDTVGRWSNIPTRSIKAIDLEQPVFENPDDNPAQPVTYKS